MKVVVVESPAKAKTINKYLGSDYHVIASYGHIRDLPRKDGSVRPDEDFAMSWETDPRAEKQIKAIAQAVRGADHLYLATDPDREGEAISWHIRNVLKERKMLEGLPVQRIVFNEITKSAVLDALANPRDLNDELVEPIWPATPSITWSASPCRRCYGNCRARARPAAVGGLVDRRTRSRDRSLQGRGVLERRRQPADRERKS